MPKEPYPGIRSILAKSHSLLQRGHTERVLSHRWIQSKWKTCPQFPKAMLSPLSLVGDGLAWYSMDGSLRLLRQMAHVSAQISQLHMATALHFLISKRGGARLGDSFLGCKKVDIKETKPVSESVLPKMYGTTFIPFQHIFPIQIMSYLFARRGFGHCNVGHGIYCE